LIGRLALALPEPFKGALGAHTILLMHPLKLVFVQSSIVASRFSAPEWQ